MFQKLYGMTANISKKGIRNWMLRRFPLYLFFAFILLAYGVRGAMMMFLLFLAFFMGWTAKGLFQAIKDYRLTLRLNRVYFSQAEYDTLHRENKILHEALNAFKDASKGRGGAAAGAPQAATPRPRFDADQIREMMLQMQGEQM